MRLSRSILGITALLTWPATAGEVEDTIGSKSESNDSVMGYRTTAIDVGATTTLLRFYPYLEADAGASLQFVVYHYTAGFWGDMGYDLIWSALGSHPGGEAFVESPEVGLTLHEGERYLIGTAFDGDEVKYWYEYPLVDNEVSFGRVVGGVLADSDWFWDGAPDRINRELDTADVGYYTRVVVDGGEDEDGDGVPTPEDCDDEDPTVFPGAVETCDGRDEDCDEEIDDGLEFVKYWRDYDHDGYGDAFGPSALRCDELKDHVPNNHDCDDTDPTIHGHAVETCDGRDEDCDEVIDNDVVFRPVWPDNDGDSFGDRDATPEDTCLPLDPYTADRSGDCDDTNPAIHRDATETCDGVDNDCDDDIDEELPSFELYIDDDLDGFGDPSSKVVDCGELPGLVKDGTDCDDSRPEAFPGADELCNGLDEDCDGLPGADEVDQDGDDVLACDDCDDDDPSVHPGADEPCNGIDNDCDGDVPEPGDCDTTSGTSGTTGGGGSGSGGGGGGGGAGPADPHAGESLVVAPCGCSSSTGGSSAAWFLGLAGLISLRRRRPSLGPPPA
jgi:MYXO-CTERM domain-containing protein